MRAARTIPTIVTIAVMMATASPSQTIFTEDFESPIVGNYATFNSGQLMVTANHTWTITLNSVDLFNGIARTEADAFDGVQAVDMTGSPDEGSMETTFATTPGTMYELAFHYARNSLIGPEPADMRVEVIGVTTALEDSVHHASAQYVFSDYQTYQGLFTADTTETTIRFTGRDPGVAGITLDAITITVAGPTAAGSPSHERDAIVGAQPNPFNPAVTIDYAIAEAGAFDVRIYDARGALVSELVREVRPVGVYSVRWNGTDVRGRRVASGIYFAVLSTPRGMASRKLVLLK